jgi:hypothetical protein
MSKLKKQIAQVEKDIDDNNAYISYQYSQLKESMNMQAYIGIGLVSSFLLGFIIVREKKPAKIIRRLTTMTLSANRIYNKLKFIL